MATDLTLGQMVELFHSYNLSHPTLSKATRDYYRMALNYFSDYIGDATSVAKIKETDIDLYRASLVSKDLSYHSINSYLRGVKVFLRWAKRKNYLDELPEVEMIRVSPFTPKPVFEQGEFAALLAACEKETTELLRLRAVAILRLLNCTGLRASELCRIRWQDISHQTLDNRQAHVVLVEGAKRGGWRLVPFSQETWEAISAYRAELAQPHGQGRKRQGYAPSQLFMSLSP